MSPGYIVSVGLGWAVAAFGLAWQWPLLGRHDGRGQWSHSFGIGFLCEGVGGDKAHELCVGGRFGAS